MAAEMKHEPVDGQDLEEFLKHIGDFSHEQFVAEITVLEAECSRCQVLTKFHSEQLELAQSELTQRESDLAHYKVALERRAALDFRSTLAQCDTVGCSYTIHPEKEFRNPGTNTLHCCERCQKQDQRRRKHGDICKKIGAHSLLSPQDPDEWWHMG